MFTTTRLFVVVALPGVVVVVVVAVVVVVVGVVVVVVDADGELKNRETPCGVCAPASVCVCERKREKKEECVFVKVLVFA